MEFFIHTTREKQHTAENLPPSILRRTTFVTEMEMAPALIDTYGDDRVWILPKGLTGLSAARQWTMEQAGESLLMFMDDDLQFNIRTEDMKLKKPTDQELEMMFDILEGWLQEDIALVGISPRAGNNRCTNDYEENTRIMRCYGFNRDILISEGIRWDRLRLLQDFDVTLGLLTKGYKNRLLYTYCNGEVGGANAPGGCSAYRTPKMKTEVACELHKLYPGIVDVVQKKSKTGWAGMKKLPDGTTIRTEVVVQWKKAYRPKLAAEGITNFL